MSYSLRKSSRPTRLDSFQKENRDLLERAEGFRDVPGIRHICHRLGKAEVKTRSQKLRPSK